MKALTNFLIDFARTFIADEHGGSLAIAAYSPPSGTAAVSIEVLSEQFIASAPFQINLQANVTDFGISAGATDADYDPQFHDIEYIWSIEKVGDGGVYSTSAYSAVSELPTSMKAKGTKYGKNICHVIGKDDVTAGVSSTFRFTVTAVNLATGTSATSAAVDRVVEHPDDVFDADETFVVRSSSLTSHPSTNNSYYSSMNAARSAANATSLTKARICVEKGYNWARLEGLGGPTDSTTIKGYLVDTWGTGDAEVNANDAGSFFLCDAPDVCESIQYDGFTIVYSAGSRGFSGRGALTQPENMCITVSDFVLDRVTLGAERVSGVGRGWVAFNNYRHTEYSYCGSLSFLDANAKGLSYIGCAIADNPAGNSDNVSPIGSENTGGGGWALRVTTMPKFYVSNSHFFTKQGWFVNTAGISTTQPNWRLTVSDGSRGHFSQCLMEGSGQTILRLGKDVSGIANMVVDRCFFTSAYGLQQFIEVGVPATIRNNIFVMSPGRSPTVYNELEQVGRNDGNAVGSPVKYYNNTLINYQTGTAAANIGSGSLDVIDANNISHQPYKDTPQDAGSFTLTEIYDTKQDGYNTLQSGQDPVYVCRASVSNAFTVGEIVTGSISGVSKTYVGTRNRFRNDGMLAFEMPIIYDNLSAAGIDRFDSADVLTGSLGGAATMGSMYSSQGHDTAMFATGTIPFTIMPTHVLAFDAQTGNFTEGETLTGGSSAATGTICQVQDDGTTGRIFLRDVTGTFSDNETITDGAGGSATANGAAVSAGTGAVWVPTSAVTPDTATWATRPYTRRDFFGTASHNSKGAVKV